MSQSNIRPRRVGFYGGSFDPPHRGHLAVAHAAMAALPLDQVLFAPVGAQPLKPAGSTAGFEDRVHMTRLAIANEAGFRLSLADAPKPGGRPNYTLDTLTAVKKDLPPHSQLFCLMGADAFAGLQLWYKAAEIPFVAPLIVASRPGQPLEDMHTLLPPGLSLEIADAPEFRDRDEEKSRIAVERYCLVDPAGRRSPFFLLPDVDVPISATAIRDQFRNESQTPLSEESAAADRELVPETVADYIRSRRLYR